MKASLKYWILGLCLLAPFASAHAQAPALSPIPSISLNAGTSRSVNVVAVDVDGRSISLTATLPGFGMLNSPTVGTGSVATTLTLTPTAANVGSFTAAVTAMAGGVSTVRTFDITVNAAGTNLAPVVTAPALEQVVTGSNLSFTVNASDPDADAITSLDVSGLPFGATFTPNGSSTSAAFNWTPAGGQDGEYDLTFTATNSSMGSAVTHITVTSAPTITITPINDVTLAEGSSLSVPVSASGPAGVVIDLTATLPAFGTLNPPGTGTGSVNTTILLTPPAGSAGTHHASVTATSLGGSATEEFDIIVTGSTGGGNNAPVLSAPANATVDVGSTLGFDVSASDLDGDHVDLFGSALPPGADFLDHGDNTGTFTWSPTASQVGTFTASFSGTDGRGGSGSASTIITVSGGAAQNHAPTVSAPPVQAVDEGVHLSFDVNASDVDGDHVALSATSVPAGGTFSDQGNNTGTFSWTPGSTQSGVYEVAFNGDDGHGGTGTASTMITVNDVTGGGGGGGGTGDSAKACVIGKFKVQKETTCFRIRPVNNSFDVRNVVLSSITLHFHGQSIHALADGVMIERECHATGGGGHGDDDGDDDGDHGGGGGNGNGNGDHGNGNGHHDAASLRLGGDHPDGDDDGDDNEGEDSAECGLSCKEHNLDDQGTRTGQTCDSVAVRACFSTQALIGLFAGATLPCDLVDAEMHALLMDGTTVVAHFQGDKHKGGGHGEGEGNGEGNGNGDKDKDKDKDKGGQDGRTARVMNISVRPNPLNPSTVVSFTMAQEGKVRVTVYDMHGRLVKTLLDDYRAAGQQKLTWDGSNSRNLKVSSGVYFFRIQAPEGQVVQRVAVVK
jgi:putative Ig domain-containing protein/flagellar hook capping protein FlgD